MIRKTLWQYAMRSTEVTCPTGCRFHIRSQMPNEEHDGKDGIFRAVLVDGTIVGNISVEQKSDVYGKDAEIGYLLITEKWSQGIMTEAVGQICNLAFSSLDIIRITGLVYEPNSGSRRVLEKNGFILEGILKHAVVKDGSIYNLCIYGKLR